MSPSQIKLESNQYQQYSTNDPYLDMSMSEDLDTTNNESTTKLKCSNGNKVNRFFADGDIEEVDSIFSQINCFGRMVLLAIVKIR